MYLFRLFAGVAAYVAAGPVWAQSAEAATLNELLDRAARNNRDLLAVRQRIEEAKGRLRQAGVRPAPTLDAGGVTGRPLATPGEEQFTAGISREFEMAGKRSKRLEVAERQLAVAEAEYQERTRQLRFDISARYADYAAEVERLGVVDRLIETSRRSIDLTRARVEKGDAATLELNLQEVELSRAEAQRAAAVGRVESARADISRLAGLEAGETWSVNPQADLPPPVDKADLTKQALERRPDLRIMRLIERQGNAETALAAAEARPNVTVSAGYGRVYSRFDDQFGAQLRDRDDVLSIGVSVPLFSRERNLGNIEASVARTRAAQLRKEYLERAIPLEIEAAWQRMESARRALASLNRQALPLAGKNLEVIRQAYQLGQLRMLDVLNEQRRVLDTQLAAIDMQAELRRSMAELERAAGGSIQ